MKNPTGNPPKAVTFDVGGTLIDPWPSVGHVYAEVARELDHGAFEPDELTRRFSVAWKKKKAFDYSKASWSALVAQTFDGLVMASDLPHLFASLYSRFADAPSWRVHPDVHPTLEALRARGLKLGVISNWDERLRPLLDSLRLSERFDTLVVSHDLGVTKPHPELFRLAAARLQLPPAMILHVGDSRTEDYEGARAAEFQGALLERGKPSGSERIESLKELIRMEIGRTAV